MISIIPAMKSVDGSAFRALSLPSPLILNGKSSPPALVFIRPFAYSLKALARTRSLPYTLDPSMYEVMELSCWRGAPEPTAEKTT